MKIIQIAVSPGDERHDYPDIVYALFDDGNIGSYARGSWEAINQPPKDLFESIGFITNNYKHIVYICLDETLCDQKVFYSDMVGEIKELEKIYRLEDVENLYPNTKFNRLATNPVKEVFGLTVLSTWVSK